MQDIGGTLVKHPREFSARVLESSEVDLNKDIVIEGIRHVDVYESLQNLLGPAEYDLVYVNASEREILSRLRDEHTPEIAIPELEKDETEEEVRDVLPKLASITVGWREGLEAEDLSGQVLTSINERLARVKLLQEYHRLDWAKYHRLVEKKAFRRLTTDERVEMEGFLKAIEQFDQQEEFDSRYKFERAIDAHQRYLRSVDRLIDGLESWVKPYEVH